MVMSSPVFMMMMPVFPLLPFPCLFGTFLPAPLLRRRVPLSIRPVVIVITFRPPTFIIIILVSVPLERVLSLILPSQPFSLQALFLDPRVPLLQPWRRPHESGSFDLARPIRPSVLGGGKGIVV
jgi:hypothetical protein